MDAVTNKWDDIIIRILNTVYYEEAAAGDGTEDPVKKKCCVDSVYQTTDAGEKDEKVSANKALTIVVSEKDIYDLLDEVRKVFMAQPPCLEVGVPIKICGDTHGQFSDLIRLFAQCGFPPSVNYLFLGDYVDRGKQNLELVLLLFGYKLRFPNNFFLLRGNHETQAVNKHYGFFEECLRRYSAKLYEAFNDCFNCMPLVALVGERILCMHGGISPEIKDLGMLADIKRPIPLENGTESLEMDLLWADPMDGLSGWEKNARGASWSFGKDALAEFLLNNDLDMIARAHQVVQDGYEFFGDRRLVTLFSAPHYCGQFDNAAAVMLVDEKLVCSFEILHPLDAYAKPENKTCVMPAGGGLLMMNESAARASQQLPPTLDVIKTEEEEKKMPDLSPNGKKKEKSQMNGAKNDQEPAKEEKKAPTTPKVTSPHSKDQPPPPAKK